MKIFPNTKFKIGDKFQDSDGILEIKSIHKWSFYNTYQVLKTYSSGRFTASFALHENDFNKLKRLK